MYSNDLDQCCGYAICILKIGIRISPFKKNEDPDSGVRILGSYNVQCRYILSTAPKGVGRRHVFISKVLKYSFRCVWLQLHHLRDPDLYGELLVQEGDPEGARLRGHQPDLAGRGQRARRRVCPVQHDAAAQELRHDRRLCSLLEQSRLRYRPLLDLEKAVQGKHDVCN